METCLLPLEVAKTNQQDQEEYLMNREVDGEVDGEVVGVNYLSTESDYCENQLASSNFQLYQPLV